VPWPSRPRPTRCWTTTGGMAITVDVLGIAGVSLVSDDNFGATQITRVLNLVARLP